MLPAPADSSLVTISVDEAANPISFTCQDRTGGVATSHASTTFDLDAGFAGDPDGFTLTIVDGKVFTQAVSGGNVSMDGCSDLTLYGSNPLNNGTTVDLKSADCFVYFLNKLPSEVNGSESGKFISTGFKGRVGAGLIGYNGGTYNVDGWGSDIWGTVDECRFTCKGMTGDAEIIAKVTWVQDTHTWAKGGVMMRSDLSAGSPNAFVFQRPDKQITFQSRTAAGGVTTSVGPVGGTGAVKWVRLVRSGNNFSGYYSTNSATGPWTQVGATTSIALPATVKTLQQRTRSQLQGADLS